MQLDDNNEYMYSLFLFLSEILLCMSVNGYVLWGYNLSNLLKFCPTLDVVQLLLLNDAVLMLSY